MRDDAKPVDSEMAFDPANPNAGPVLNWKADPAAYIAGKVLGIQIAGFVNAAKRAALLDPTMVHADLMCIHCNGRPQDFSIWKSLDPVKACEVYSQIYYNLDRRTGKLPDFVKLPTDKRG